MRSGNIDKRPDGSAIVLKNIFPTTEGGRLRKGTDVHATLPGSCKHLANYESPSVSKFFAADPTGIYDATSPARS